MRTVFLAQEAYSRFGGIQRFNIRFIDALTEIAHTNNQWNAEVLIRSDSLQDVPATVSQRMRVACFDGSAVRFSIAVIRSAFTAQRVVIGHINLLPLAVFIKLLRPQIHISLVAHGIEVWGDSSFRRYKWWEPQALRYCISRVLSVSDYTAQRLRACTGYPAERLTIFPNVVDADTHWEEAVPGGVGTQLLTVTRLGSAEGKKRVDVVIAALAELRKAGLNVTLNVVGDGELRPALAEIAANLGVKSSVIFHGRVSDEQLSTLYRKADVFVLPSEKEGFGIVYLEAWKAGLPVVAARATAVPEVINDGIDGLLVDPVSPSTLSVALKNLLCDGVLRARMVNEGRTKILQKFNHSAFVERLRFLLDS